MRQRILIVDDSPFIRRMLSDWIAAEPDLEVVGTAGNGEEAVELAVELKPDVVTLDVEMPVRDGLWALQEIMRKAPTQVLMVSSVTRQGAEQTIRALELGAADFVTKPDGGAGFKFVGSKDELLSKVRAVRTARTPREHAFKGVWKGTKPASDRVVLVASSTGGPKAVMTLFQSLPKNLGVPILVAQHMPAGFTATFAKRLDQVGNIPTREAACDDLVAPGQALVAPGGRHMLVGPDGRVVLSDDPPVHGVKPAADLLFESGARHFGARCLGVVLTGMGKDGAAGAMEVRRHGGTVLGEAESSCVVYGMPKAAKDAGGIDAEFPIEDMGQAVVANLSQKVRHAS